MPGPPKWNTLGPLFKEILNNEKKSLGPHVWGPSHGGCGSLGGLEPEGVVPLAPGEVIHEGTGIHCEQLFRRGENTQAVWRIFVAWIDTQAARKIVGGHVVGTTVVATTQVHTVQLSSPAGSFQLGLETVVEQVRNLAPAARAAIDRSFGYPTPSTQTTDRSPTGELPVRRTAQIVDVVRLEHETTRKQLRQQHDATSDQTRWWGLVGGLIGVIGVGLALLAIIQGSIDLPSGGLARLADRNTTKIASVGTTKASDGGSPVTMADSTTSTTVDQSVPISVLESNLQAPAAQFVGIADGASLGILSDVYGEPAFLADLAGTVSGLQAGQQLWLLLRTPDAETFPVYAPSVFENDQWSANDVWLADGDTKAGTEHTLLLVVASDQLTSGWSRFDGQPIGDGILGELMVLDDVTFVIPE